MVFSFRDSANRDDAKAVEGCGAARAHRAMVRREAAKKAKQSRQGRLGAPWGGRVLLPHAADAAGRGHLLEVQVSFVQPMAACANALLEHSRRQLRASARGRRDAAHAAGGGGRRRGPRTGDRRGKRADRECGVERQCARARRVDRGGGDAAGDRAWGRRGAAAVVGRTRARLASVSSVCSLHSPIHRRCSAPKSPCTTATSSSTSCGRRAPTDAAAVDGSDLFQVFGGRARRRRPRRPPRRHRRPAPTPRHSHLVGVARFKGTATLGTSTTPAPPPTVAQPSPLDHRPRNGGGAAKLADLCDLDAMVHVAAAGRRRRDAAAYEARPGAGRWRGSSKAPATAPPPRPCSPISRPRSAAASSGSRCRRPRSARRRGRRW